MKKINVFIFILTYALMAFLLDGVGVLRGIYVVVISWSGLVAISYARIFPIYFHMFFCVVWATVTTTFFRNAISILGRHV